VKESIGELFRHESSIRVGEKFDNPFTFARDLRGAFPFLTARAVGSKAFTAGSGTPGITRGFNYGNSKAQNLIKIAKQLIVFKFCEQKGRKLVIT
jgi:hypothetical protein